MNRFIFAVAMGLTLHAAPGWIDAAEWLSGEATGGGGREFCGQCSSGGTFALFSAASLGPGGAVGAIPATGQRRLLLMRTVFADETDPALGEAEGRQLLDEVESWYAAHSYRRLTISGELTSALRLPQARAWYAGQPPSLLLDDARAAAAQAGYGVESYDLDAVRHSPIDGWNFLGLSQTGGKGIWLQSSASGVFIHELGHSFGLGHANGWVAVDDSVAGPGVLLDYGNPFDTMGWPHGNPGACHFSVARKRQLDWLPAAAVSNVTVSGRYRLTAFDGADGWRAVLQGLVVRKDESRDYWIEFRQALTDNPWCERGILVNLMTNTGLGAVSGLLDATPGSPGPQNGFADAALVVGRTLTDPRAGVHITPLGIGTNGNDRWVEVQVNFGAFPGNTAPVVDLKADRTTAGVGQTVSISAQAQDPDGDGLAYSWDVGDGDAAVLGLNTDSVTKFWGMPGRYVVRCAVSDLRGGVTIRQLLVTVGQPGAGDVVATGVVRDGDGRPVSGARVHNGLSGEAYRGALSDSDGRYLLANLGVGSHQLQVVRRGFRFVPAAWSNPVTVSNDVSGLDWIGEPLPRVDVVVLDDQAVESSVAPTNEARFAIQRTGSTDAKLAVKLRLSGAASLSVDYRVSPPIASSEFTLVLEPGVSVTNLVIVPLLDALAEGDEEVTLSLVEDREYLPGDMDRGSVRVSDPELNGNRAPVAGPDQFPRYPHLQYVLMTVSALLANDSDPDGDSISLVEVDAFTALGGVTAQLGESIYYLPPDGVVADDSFGYTIMDSKGVQVRGLVRVTVTPVPPPRLRISVADGLRVIEGTQGAPGLRGRLLAIEQLPGGTWRNLGGLTNDASGSFRWVEPASTNPAARFFRVVIP